MNIGSEFIELYTFNAWVFKTANLYKNLLSLKNLLILHKRTKELLVKKIFNFPTYIFLIIIGGLTFIPILGAVPLFDKDEIYFAEIAREMLLSNNWLEPSLFFETRYDIAPFFIWLQALSMKYLGVNEFAARLPNALCGIFTVLVIYRIGKRLYSPYFGLVWSLVFVGSFVPQFYFRTSLSEPWFNLFVFLALYHVSRILAVNQEPGEFYRRSDIKKWLLYASFFTAMAMLTKGTVGLILVYGATFITFVLSMAKNGMGYLNYLKWILLTLFFSSLWLLYDGYVHGFEYALNYIDFNFHHLNIESAEEHNYWYFHVLILLAGCFPASAFVFQGFTNLTYEPVYQKILRQMMVASLIMVAAFFTLMKTNIIHYSTTAYIPISFLATLNIDRIFKGEIKWTWVEYLILLLMGMFWCIVLIGVPFSGANLEIIKPLIQDKFVLGMLQADVQWDNNEMFFGIIYSVFFIISFVLFLLKKNIAAVLTLFISTGYMTQIMVYYFVPKIEKYSQGALIDFCKNNANDSTMVLSLNHPSYAHLFYSNQKKSNFISPKINESNIKSTTIKKIVFTSRIENYTENKKFNPHLQELYQKNGFVFWIKK